MTSFVLMPHPIVRAQLRLVVCPRLACTPRSPSDTRIKPSVESPKSGILVTEVITFDEIARWVILGDPRPLLTTQGQPQHWGVSR